MILRSGWERISAHLGMVLKKARVSVSACAVDVDVGSEVEGAGVVISTSLVVDVCG